MKFRNLQNLCILGLLVTCACKFPEPTRIEDPNHPAYSAKKELQPTDSEELQRQVRELKADHQSVTEDWDQKLRAMQDKIDILEHQLLDSKQQSERVAQDIDHRLIELEKRPTPTPATPVVVPAASTEVTPEKTVASTSEQEYQTILDSFLEEKKYDKSIQDFKKYIQKYPKEPLTSNAQYWIGEGYYAKGDYAKAITEFQKVIDLYPSSTKRCDSLLKQGMSFANMKDMSNSKLFLKETTEQCPNTEAAKKAVKLL